MGESLHAMVAGLETGSESESESESEAELESKISESKSEVAELEKVQAAEARAKELKSAEEAGFGAEAQAAMDAQDEAAEAAKGGGGGEAAAKEKAEAEAKAKEEAEEAEMKAEEDSYASDEEQEEMLFKRRTKGMKDHVRIRRLDESRPERKIVAKHKQRQKNHGGGDLFPWIKTAKAERSWKTKQESIAEHDRAIDLAQTQLAKLRGKVNEKVEETLKAVVDKDAKTHRKVKRRVHSTSPRKDTRTIFPWLEKNT